MVNSTQVAARLPIDQLHEIFENSPPATDGWDLVCSYSMDVLNEIFAKSLGIDRRAVNFIRKMIRKDEVTQVEYHYTLDMFLSAEQVTFQAGVVASCLIKLSILGGTYRVNDAAGAIVESGPFPSTYSIQVSVPISAICGNKIPADQDAIVFDSVDADFYLHFKTLSNPQVVFEIHPPLPSPSAGSENNNVYALGVVLEYFTSTLSEIQLGWKSDNSPTVAISVVPSSCVVTACSDVVSFFVSAQDSNAGPGDPAPAFEFEGKSFLPVAQGMNASIVVGSQYVSQLTTKASNSQVFSPYIAITQAMYVLFGGKQNCQFDEGNTVFNTDAFATVNISVSP
jgi:hypothetical protein